MVSSEYYRRQAELCLQLALTMSDQSTAFWLVKLAEGYNAKADEAERTPESMPAYMIGLESKNNRERDRD